jgi:hypothetical protein
MGIGNPYQYHSTSQIAQSSKTATTDPEVPRAADQPVRKPAPEPECACTYNTQGSAEKNPACAVKKPRALSRLVP